MGISRLAACFFGGKCWGQSDQKRAKMAIAAAAELSDLEAFGNGKIRGGLHVGAISSARSSATSGGQQDVT